MRHIWLILIFLAPFSGKAQILELELQNALIRLEASEMKEQWVTNGMNPIQGLLYAKQLYKLNRFEDAEPHYLKALDEDLLQDEELYQLIHILIANKKTGLAHDLTSLLKSKNSARFRLIEQIMSDARNTSNVEKWEFKAKYDGLSPVISEGKLLYSYDKTLWIQTSEQDLKEVKIKRLKERYIRHAFVSGINNNIWITHPVDGRFRISSAGKKKQAVYKKPKEFVRSDHKSNYIHACLNAGGDILIFSSDKPGGYGGYDLYMSFKSREGWTEPKNLGPVINSEKNEIMPWLSTTNVLYFSSDGLPGLGGFDVFSAELSDISNSLNHLPYPLNSALDELGYCRQKKDLVYVGKRIDDNYEIIQFEKKEVESPAAVTIKGNVKGEDGEPVSSALILWELDDRGLFTETDQDGHFSIDIHSSYGKNLVLTTKKEGYLEQQLSVEWSAMVKGMYRVRPLQIELKQDPLTVKTIIKEKPVNPLPKKEVTKPPQPQQAPVKKDPVSKEKAQPPVRVAPTKENKPKATPSKPSHSYYVVLASSKNELEINRLKDQYQDRFPGITLLQTDKGYIRLAVPAGDTSANASKVLKECRLIVKDCWLLKEKSTQ
jgi:cell division septation protein DedD